MHAADGAARVGSLLMDGLLVAHELHLQPADVQATGLRDKALIRGARIKWVLRDLDASGADRDIEHNLPHEFDKGPNAAEHERHHEPCEEPVRLAGAVHLDDLHDEDGNQRVPSQAYRGHYERHPSGCG